MRLVLLLSCVALPALGQDGPALLEQARRQLDDLEAEAAIKTLVTVEKQPFNTRQTLEELHLLRGIAFGLLDKPQLVRDAFRWLLLVNPGAQLPKDQPPRVQTPFLEARAWADSNGPFGFEVAAELEGTDVRWVSVAAKNDVLRLARSVRFHVDGKDYDVPFKNDVARLAVPGPTVRWWAEVLTDELGLLRPIASADAPRTDGGAVEAPPARPDEEVTPTPAAPEPGGTWRRPLGGVLLGVGAAAVATGAVFGVLSRTARDTVTDAERRDDVITGVTQVEAQRLEAQSVSQAIVANALFIAGGVVAATGLVFVIVGPDSQPLAQLTPAPGGLVLSGRF